MKRRRADDSTDYPCESRSSSGTLPHTPNLHRLGVWLCEPRSATTLHRPRGIRDTCERRALIAAGQFRYPQAPCLTPTTPFTTEFKREMRRWRADNPQHKHGVHRHLLEQFDLDAARVRAVTDDYRRKYLSG